MEFLKKFHNKFIVLLTFGIIIPVTAIASYSIISATQNLTSVVSKNMAIEGSINAGTISLFFDNIKSDVLYLCKTPPVQGIVRSRENKGIDPLDNSTYENWVSRMDITFRSFMENKPYYYQLRYIDENGQELLKLQNNNGEIETIPRQNLRNIKEQDYFSKAIALGVGEIYASSINLNRENNVIQTPYKPVIRYATPIYNKAGRKKGIIIANIAINSAFELGKNAVMEKELKQEFIVVNADGYYLFNPDSSKNWGFELGNNQATIYQDYPQQVAEKIVSGGQGFLDEDTDHLLSYHTLSPTKNKESSLVLIYQAPKAVIFAAVTQLKVFSVVFVVISLGIVLGIGLIILKKLTTSVLELTGVVSSFSEQLLSNIDEQSYFANQQSSSVQETTTTMDELSASSRQSAQQAELAAKVAQQALNLVEQGTQAMEQSLHEMGLLKGNVEAIATQIQSLSDRAQEIDTVSDLVRDLANQTNMLALNAAVEAVHAGEYGKGFSVVASEIRTLADRSKQSGQNINQLVKAIQGAIQATVIVAHEGTKNVETGAQIAQKTAAVFEKVAVAISEIADNSQQIALTSKQQAIATQQVTETMNSLSQGTKEMAVGINQTKTGTEQVNDAALKLKDTV